MTGFSHRHKTLGQLRKQLRVRLGFIAQGPAAENNRDVLNDFLQEAQEEIYEELELAALRKKCTLVLSAGSYLYDWHNDAEDEDIDPGRVLSMWIEIGDTCRDPLVQGITERMRELKDLRDFPTRYDVLNGQMELWPIPGGAYNLIIEYTQDLGRFTQDADRATVPDRLLFLKALATAKAHYRHPDANVAGQDYTNMLRRVKSQQFSNKRYVARTSSEPERAQIGRTANGYVLRSY
jgi:hypothetical protein